MRENLIKSKSLYTIRKKHATVADGTIYENDYVTILPNDGIYDDEMALFSESNFKYRIRKNKNDKKRHVRGEFIKTDEGSETWTINDVSSTISDDYKIELKPNYTSLKDFAYYGSAVQLLHGTVNDIIMRFPGGLSYYGEGGPQVYVDGTIYYLVSNEFNIDCWTSGGDMSSGSVVNPMRLLAASYMNYEDGDGNPIVAPSFTANSSNCINSIIGEVDFGCGVFSVYMDSEYGKHLISEQPGEKGKIIIRPKKEYIDSFWDTMDDFEKTLLNRDSIPVYKATFETPYFTESGYFYTNKSYVWPTVGDDGFTPDITTGKFQGYLTSLISLAQYHDEFDSDNLWRMLTHESIKNLDWTFIRKSDGETEDLSNIDSSRISSLIRVWGRQFDDIKRYTDNIKSSNNVSYDEKNNTPDYFLSDNVENAGWIAKNVAPFATVLDFEIKDDKGNQVITSGKTQSYVNSAFMRNLLLNSNYIQSMKGTRRGIETILGLFGYHPSTDDDNGAGTFSISEFVDLVDLSDGNPLSYTDASKLRVLGEYTNYDNVTNMMDGYPVIPIIPASAKNKEDDRLWYIMPWFDNKTEYTYPFHFQSDGGWGKCASKTINLSNLTTATTISPGNSVSIYRETLPYMHYATTISEMLSIPTTDLYKNTVCYVTDISEMMQTGFYAKQPGDKDADTDYSHYFVLKNTALAGYVGFVSNSLYNCYGWRCVYEKEISNGGNISIDNWEDGLRVLYMESLTTVEEGNNTHVGYGLYDDGDKYIRRFTNIFENAIDDGLYEYLKKDSGDTYLEVTQFGFPLKTMTDNKKCAFFQDSYELKKKSDEGNYLESIGEKDAVEWNTDVLGKVFSPEAGLPTDNSYGALDECQANSIINIKKLVINFNIEGNIYFQKYIEDVVLKYLELMIPSTTILEYRFDNKVRNITSIVPDLTSGSFTQLTAAHVAVDNNDDRTVVWREYPVPVREINGN